MLGNDNGSGGVNYCDGNGTGIGGESDGNGRGDGGIGYYPTGNPFGGGPRCAQPCEDKGDHFSPDDASLPDNDIL